MKNWYHAIMKNWYHAIVAGMLIVSAIGWLDTSHYRKGSYAIGRLFDVGIAATVCIGACQILILGRRER